MKWFNTLSHNRWLEQETDRIFDLVKIRSTDRIWLVRQ